MSLGGGGKKSKGKKPRKEDLSSIQYEGDNKLTIDYGLI